MPAETAARFRDGDRRAFEEIYMEERLRLFRFILRKAGAPELAEEIMQEVWVHAWAMRGQLRDPGRLTAWLYRIARNTTHTQLESVRRRLTTMIGNGEEEGRAVDRKPDPAPGPRRKAQEAQWREIFDQEVQALDPIAQEIFALRFAAGLNLREIAETLELPLGTVASKLARALGRVRASLDKKGIRPPFD